MAQAFRANWSMAESCSKQHAMRTTVLTSCKPSRPRHHYRERLEYFRLDFAWSQIHRDPQTRRDLILPMFNEQLVSEKLRRGTDITPLRARQLCGGRMDLRDWLDVGFEPNGGDRLRASDEYASDHHQQGARSV
jgi:hypothetical protein